MQTSYTENVVLSYLSNVMIYFVSRGDVFPFAALVLVRNNPTTPAPVRLPPLPCSSTLEACHRTRPFPLAAPNLLPLRPQHEVMAAARAAAVAGTSSSEHLSIIDLWWVVASSSAPLLSPALLDLMAHKLPL